MANTRTPSRGRPAADTAPDSAAANSMLNIISERSATSEAPARRRGRSAPREAWRALLLARLPVLPEVLRAAGDFHRPRFVGQMAVQVGGQRAIQQQLGEPDRDG